MIRDKQLKLLVGLCASAIRGRQSRDVSNDADTSSLLDLARRHRVQGLAWFGLAGGNRSEQSAAADLFEDTQAIARNNLLAVAAAARLFDECDRRGLAVLFLKGLTLGALAHPKAMLKMSSDVDVLVDPAQIDQVEECLTCLGYRPDGVRRHETRRSARAKEWVWVGADGTVLDLHVRLADNPTLLANVSARSPKQDIEVAPSVRLPTLRTEELFAYLCVHGTASAWFRLKWATDLAAFLHGRSDEEIRRLHVAAESHGAGRCPDVALLVVEELFGPLVPADLLSRAARDPVTRLLKVLSIREIEQQREPLERPLGTVLIHAGQLFIHRGARFTMRELGRQFSYLLPDQAIRTCLNFL